MRILLTLFILLIASGVFAQQKPNAGANADSIAVKLEQYKKLRDTGVISDEEYNKAKTRLMNVSSDSTEETKVDKAPRFDSLTFAKMNERYKPRIIAGSIITSIGGALAIGDVLLGTLSKHLSPTDTSYNYKDAVKTRQTSEIALGLFSGVAAITGAAILALGLKDRAIIRHKDKTLTMDIEPYSLGLVYNF